MAAVSMALTAALTALQGFTGLFVFDHAADNHPYHACQYQKYNCSSHSMHLPIIILKYYFMLLLSQQYFSVLSGSDFPYKDGTKDKEIR